jgi:hypothetical protein
VGDYCRRKGRLLYMIEDEAFYFQRGAESFSLSTFDLHPTASNDKLAFALRSALAVFPALESSKGNKRERDENDTVPTLEPRPTASGNSVHPAAAVAPVLDPKARNVHVTKTTLFLLQSLVPPPAVAIPCTRQQQQQLLCWNCPKARNAHTTRDQKTRVPFPLPTSQPTSFPAPA